MDWREELRKVLRVQDADRQSDAFAAERQALVHDAREAVLQRDLLSRRARVAAGEAELAGLERDQRLSELERKAQEAERERATRRLYGGEMKSARDAEGLQKNIDGSSKKIDDAETAILEAMEKAEALRHRLVADREGVERTEAALRQRRSGNRARLAEIDGQLPGVAAARLAAAEAVDPRALREYERVRAGSGGVGAAAAAAGACGACGFSLSPYWMDRLHQSAAPVTCEHCGRLLVDA